MTQDQDASSSAYPIMNSFLLNTEIAMRTNLIPTPDSNKRLTLLKDELLTNK